MSQDQKPSRMRVVAGAKSTLDRRATPAASPRPDASADGAPAPRADARSTLAAAVLFLAACAAGGALVSWSW